MLLISEYKDKSFLPFEIKPIGYGSEELVARLPYIETKLLVMRSNHPLINEAISHLWNAYFRLEDGDIEGSRTSLRKILIELLKNKLLPKIEVVEEAEDYVKNMSSLLSKMAEFVQYGGPHLGPAPRTTTEMILCMTIDLLNYLSISIENKIVKLKIT